MAVQAQYPSNLLFLDRGEAERREVDVPRPPQPPPPAFLDDVAGVSTAMFFSNGASGNVRRRTREAPAMAPPRPPAAATAVSQAEYMSMFALQQQPQPQPAFVSLAQLHRPSASTSPSPASLVSTGLRLAFEEQQQQHNNNQMNASCSASSPLSDELACLMKQHGDEIDRFLRDQGEQQQRALSERRRRHDRALLLAADEAASRRLREKAAEVELAARRGAELEERLVRLRAEAAAWQAKALAQHATAVTLHSQLQQAAAAAKASGEELAGGESGPADSAESACVDARRAGTQRTCRACALAPATVVVFPCRHLCLCSGCLVAGDIAAGAAGEAALACPVCGCVRTASVEAILS